MHRGANPASLDRWIAWPVMSRYQEKQAIAAHDGLFQGSIDCAPCGVQGHAMKVEHAVRFDGSAAKALVPASVEIAIA